MTPTTTADPEVPRLQRRTDGRVLAGVAGGVADHLGLAPLHVRIAFAVLAAIGGFGVVLYGALWVFVPVAGPEDLPPGAAAAERSGMRPRRWQSTRRGDPGVLVALAALAVGAALLLGQTSIGVPLHVLGPALLVAVGLALVWTQADESERERLRRGRWGRFTPGPFAGGATWTTVLRLVGGVLLVAGGLAAFLVGQVRLPQLGSALAAVAVVVLGIGLLAVPFLWRLLRNLEAERHERLLNQQRADVAAHLHDSVLQTLALIQRQATDSRAVVALARAQERDLRGWLYGEQAPAEGTLRAALTAMGAEVEQVHGVPVEVVTVGDTDLDERLGALLLAAREATVNAARHSGADVVDVFAEVSQDGPEQVVEVFVRDRGKGFDPDGVPADRMGLRGSVVGRVERHGGTASVRTAVGEGTEVRLGLRRRTEPAPDNGSGPPPEPDRSAAPPSAPTPPPTPAQEQS